jgi:hypothetical protein
MDPDRFDAVCRAFNVRHSRRGVSRLLGGVMAAGLLMALGAGDTRAVKRPSGSPCRKGKQCVTHKCVGPKGQKRCACERCYALTANSTCVRTQDPMNGRCPCGFEEMQGQCVKNQCRDCFENVGGICVPEPPGTAPNGPCACGFTIVGGICVPRYPLPPR